LGYLLRLGAGCWTELYKGQLVRLAAEQVQVIKKVGQQVLGDDSRVLLFGSRVSDQALGGDIDLLFESPHPLARPAVAACELYGALVMQLGDQKIDVLVKDPTMPLAPVMQQALSTGVVL
jgi:hypothetical protein